MPDRSNCSWNTASTAGEEDGVTEASAAAVYAGESKASVVAIGAAEVVAVLNKRGVKEIVVLTLRAEPRLMQVKGSDAENLWMKNDSDMVASMFWQLLVSATS